MDAERVWADIDLDAFEHNLGVIRKRAGPGVAVILVVKADAYGHGAVAIARRAVRCGVAALGVGTSAEALELRAAGIDARVLVLGTIVDGEAPAILEHQVEIGLHSFDRLRMLEHAARDRGVRARVHLNVDTGMGRLGVLPARALELLGAVRAAAHVELFGLATHIAASEGVQAASARAQVQVFGEVVAQARAAGLLAGWIHVANSAALFSGLQPLYDAVRPGLAAYGALPSPALPGRDALRPVLSLRSPIVFLKDLPRGCSVGYDATWRAPRPTRLATLPLGYADGVPVRLSNRGCALVRGRRVPIVGRVTMDYTTLDVTDVPGVEVGERATLIGRDGDELLRLEDVAAAADTIPYEIACAVGRRVVRRYSGADARAAATATPGAGSR